MELTQEELLKLPGVYAFIDPTNDSVCYVGMSCRPISVRINEHYNTDLERLKKKIAAGGIYERNLAFHARLKQEELKVVVLYSAEPYDTRRSLEYWEMGYIRHFKPCYNSSGVICEYYFSEQEEEINWKAIEEYNKGYTWETAKKRVAEREKLKGEF